MGTIHPTLGIGHCIAGELCFSNGKCSPHFPDCCLTVFRCSTMLSFVHCAFHMCQQGTSIQDIRKVSPENLPMAAGVGDLNWRNDTGLWKRLWGVFMLSVNPSFCPLPLWNNHSKEVRDAKTVVKRMWMSPTCFQACKLVYLSMRFLIFSQGNVAFWVVWDLEQEFPICIKYSILKG